MRGCAPLPDLSPDEFWAVVEDAAQQHPLSLFLALMEHYRFGASQVADAEFAGALAAAAGWRARGAKVGEV